MHETAGRPLAHCDLVFLWAHWVYITRAQSANCKNNAFGSAGAILRVLNMSGIHLG